jgi:hypothetical protein
MSFTPNNQLQSDPTTWLRNSQTASRLFVNDQFRLAPKQKFSFHVSFGINPSALKNIDLVQRHRNEINMLVKSVDLPKFNITVETLNQYNRKKVVQSQHKFDNMNITFHDDNMGIINQLWQNYYSYYYADPVSATNNSFNRNATRSSNFINGNYGLDNGSTNPFFTYIKIYQMARHEYVSYTLVNPIIISWGSPSALAYKGDDLSEFTMGLSYEAVSYDSGVVSSETVEGFGGEHYDTTPSPLSKLVAPTYESNISSSASPTFVNSTGIRSNTTEFADTLTSQINTYQNTQLLNKATSGNSIANIITGITQGVSGLQGIAFPVPSPASTSIEATPIKFR